MVPFHGNTQAFPSLDTISDIAPAQSQPRPKICNNDAPAFQSAQVNNFAAFEAKNIR
jgi:hypothetical protein